MREEDAPPEEKWLDQEALNEHFDEVKRRYASSSSRGMEPIEELDLEQNELTKGLR